MFKRLRKLLREWWGPWDKPKPRPELYIVPKPDHAQNQQQLAEIEKKLQAGDRPRGAA